ncbi:hypothetical protein [Desulfarculus baarsii]
MKTISLRGWANGRKDPPAKALAAIGVDASTPERLAATTPFAAGDATCGCENELQAVVSGARQDVDLPRTIEQSNYFRNIVKRRDRGELPKKVVTDLEKWLSDNPDGVWENSWVRLPLAALSPLARQVLEADLAADKADPAAGRRGDAHRFFARDGEEEMLRVPVSYLLKLALADAVGRQAELPEVLRQAGLGLCEHFLSDNTSPETYSFYVSTLTPGEGMGRAVARETALRFLLTHLLTIHAQGPMGLGQRGQRVTVYFAPHPPVRQKRLNECITDAFYRELFMNPCLSGWDRGEDKHRYMHLCHEVLSRAQLNAVARLREAGVITNNLVVLPNASNISLANNGVHVTLGSKRLSAALAGGGAFGAAQEKYLGDLATKFIEHFLPLFVGVHSAAPYRLGFADFHPERVLGFLPYELDYTHLRMIWRRWRKKASLKARPFGLRLTPFGPPWLDRALAAVFGLRGDLAPDFRLLDYLAAVMSTHSSPALDGSLGNLERLKADLAQMGVFDQRMPPYLLHRQRQFAVMGFSGFEGRHYSLFPSLDGDLAPAVGLQCLLTALAFKFIAGGLLDHAHIPDDPQTESERRQVFFGAAIGLPTFFVRADSGNLLLKMILEDVRDVRPSRRYPGYLRVRHAQYRQALLRLIRREGAALIESMGLEDVLDDLARRLEDPRHTAAGRLVRGALAQIGASDPLAVEPRQFNAAAEEYYRGGLRLRHLREAMDHLEGVLAPERLSVASQDPRWAGALGHACAGRDPRAIVAALRPRLLADELPPAEALRLINLLVLCLGLERTRQARHANPEDAHVPDAASIH